MMANERNVYIDRAVMAGIVAVVGAIGSGATWVATTRIELPNIKQDLEEARSDIVKLKSGEAGVIAKRLDSHTTDANETFRTIQSTMEKLLDKQQEVAIGVTEIRTQQSAMVQDIDELKADMRQLRGAP